MSAKQRSSATPATAPKLAVLETEATEAQLGHALGLLAEAHAALEAAAKAWTLLDASASYENGYLGDGHVGALREEMRDSIALAWTDVGGAREHVRAVRAYHAPAKAAEAATAEH